MGSFGSLALMGGGSALSAFSQYRQGVTSRELAKRQARVERMQMRSEQATMRENRIRRRIENRRRMGAYMAQQGASGLAMSGSSADFIEEADARLEMALLDDARDAEMQMVARENRARMLRATGSMQEQAARWGGLGALAEGAADIYTYRKEFDDYGVT